MIWITELVTLPCYITILKLVTAKAALQLGSEEWRASTLGATFGWLMDSSRQYGSYHMVDLSDGTDGTNQFGSIFGDGVTRPPKMDPNRMTQSTPATSPMQIC